MGVLFQVKQVILYLPVSVLSQVKKIKNFTSQQKLLTDFIAAEEQRRQKEAEIQERKANAEKTAEGTLNQDKEIADTHRQEENEALNQAKSEMGEAMTVYQKVEENLPDFTRPKHQLNMDYDPIEQLREIKEKLEEAKANFLLQTLKGNKDAYASNAKKLGGNILQRIEDYRQVQSDASSSIQKMSLGWQNLVRPTITQYIRSELPPLQNQLNLANQHFKADTISDYRQAHKISKQVYSRISELIDLVGQRESEQRRRASKRKENIPSGIASGIVCGIICVLPGWIIGCIADIVSDKKVDEVPFIMGGAVIGLIIAFLVGFILAFKKDIKQ